MSDHTPRIFTTEFKERAVLRLEAGASASALAIELGARRKLPCDWRQACREHGEPGRSAPVTCPPMVAGQTHPLFY